MQKGEPDEKSQNTMKTGARQGRQLVNGNLLSPLGKETELAILLLRVLITLPG